MKEVKYLEDSFRITDVKCDDKYDKREGLTDEGYTTNAGAPTRFVVQLNLTKRWHRVYVWQISNSGTAFVKIGGQRYVVRDDIGLLLSAADSTTTANKEVL